MIYCTFVKQIGGGSCKWIMDLKDVCKLFERNKLKNCKSIGNSGNFIYESDKSKIELDEIIQELLNNYYKQEIYVFTQTQQEVINIYKNFNKIFPKYSLETKDFIYNVFITNVKDYGNTIIKQFEDTEIENKHMFLKNNVCYWKCQRNYTSTSKFYRKICKKEFKNNYTMRTIGTINRVVKRFNTE